MSWLNADLSHPTIQFLTGMLLGIVIAYSARRLRALSRSGAWAAALTGGLIFGLGGLPWAALLLAFFISSSGLSKAFARRKAALSEKFSKGSQRDWAQVLANGGLGTALVLFSVVLPPHYWIWAAYAGAMAAVNADTWATELGVFSASQPRLITSGKRVEAGTSGGVTVLGYLAALGGAALIAVTGTVLLPPGRPWVFAATITLAGLSGASFDSILGATVQGIYYCPACQKETERYPTHTCGAHTAHLRGWRWLNNDWVNYFCSLVGAIVAAGLLAILL